MSEYISASFRDVDYTQCEIFTTSNNIFQIRYTVTGHDTKLSSHDTIFESADWRIQNDTAV